MTSTSTTTPRRPPARLPPRPVRPTKAEIARDPLSLWRWMDYSSGYAILEAIREANEEERRKKTAEPK
jgi:hypothetical protein